MRPSSGGSVLMSVPSKVVLIAGESGSGKNWLARQTRADVLRLDDFFHDFDEPGLPLCHGQVDWDDPACWRAEAAVDACMRLLREGTVRVPTYDMLTSRRAGSRVIRLSERPLVIEGVFAVPMLAELEAAGFDVTALFLDRGRSWVAWLRLYRDVVKRRKPLTSALRRSWKLWRAQPAFKNAALAAGFRPIKLHVAVSELAYAGPRGNSMSTVAQRRMLLKRVVRERANARRQR